MQHTTVSTYIQSFFEKGRIVFNDKSHNKAQKKKLFTSVLVELEKEHKQFLKECNRENILKIDHQNLIIELVLS